MLVRSQTLHLVQKVKNDLMKKKWNRLGFEPYGLVRSGTDAPANVKEIWHAQECLYSFYL